MPGAPTTAGAVADKNTCPPYRENAVPAYYQGGSAAYNSQAYYQQPQNYYNEQYSAYGAAPGTAPLVSPFGAAAVSQPSTQYSQSEVSYNAQPHSGYAQSAYTQAQAYAQPQSVYSQTQGAPVYGQTQPAAGYPQMTQTASYTQPQSSYSQPQTSYSQAQAGYAQPQTAAYGATQTAATTARTMETTPVVQPSATLVQTSGSVLPNSQGVRGRANVPMGAIYSIMRESDLPVVNPQGSRLVRCVKCRAYMNCYVQFSDNGSKWACNLCSTVNETPNEYYCQLSANGERQDKYERPELHQAAIEFVASPDYMTRPPMAPSYVLLLDVSRAAVQSGFVHNVCQSMKNIIQQEQFAGVSRAQLCVITYDVNIHFYLPGSSGMPQISVVSGNTKDVFLPSNDDLLIHIKDNQEKLCQLLDQIPSFWLDQTSEESCVGAGLQAARMVLRSIGGKIIMCQCALPMAPELGLNPSHDLRKKDSKGRVTAGGSLPDPVDGVKPSSSYFMNLATAFAQSQIMADVFVAPASPIQMDLATLGSLARYTGGQVHYYPPQSASASATGTLSTPPTQQLNSDLESAMKDVVGWEGVMRIRCSKGWKLQKYHGNYNFRALDLIMLPAFTTDHAVSVQFDITDSVTTDKKFYAQAAILYTTSNGERRIRVVNHCVQTTPNLRDVASGVSLLPVLHLVTQNALDEAIAGKLADARSYIHTQIRHLITLLGLVNGAAVPGQANNGATDGIQQQQCNMYASALMKCSAFRDGRDISADERVVAWNTIRSGTVEAVYQYLLPTLMEISQMPQQQQPERASHF